MSEHELWNELGNLYFLFGTYDQAVHAYNKAIALNPAAGEPYSNLALTYVQMNRHAEASDYYERSIQLLKDELDKAVSMHKLGDVYMRLKQFPRAAEIYQQTEELVPDLGQIVDSSKSSDLLLHCQPSDTPLQPPVLVAEHAPILSPAGRVPQFVEELTPWSFDDQTEPEEDAAPVYTMSFFEETDIHDENTVFTEPLVWEPETTSHAALTSYDAQTAGSADSGAVSEANSSDAVHPSSVESIDSFPAQDHAGKRHKRRSTAMDTLAAEPSHASVMVVTDGPEIVTVPPDFSAQNVTHPDAVQYAVPLEVPVVELSQEERLEIEANISKFKRILEINPRNAFAWDTLGGHYKTLGQYEDAISAYQKAVSLDSSKAFYFHHLGLVYAAVGRHEEAMNAFERVIEVDPNHSLAHATLGGYHRKNGNEELARQHIEKARSLLANDENNYNRACMESICGNIDQSLELLELALKDKQTYVNWARKDPDLDFVRSDPRFHALLAEYSTKPS